MHDDSQIAQNMVCFFFSIGERVKYRIKLSLGSSHRVKIKFSRPKCQRHYGLVEMHCVLGLIQCCS